MQNRLFVGNLPFSATEESLRTLFAQHGKVVDATLVTERDTGRSRGFAFVEMAADADAARAIGAVDGTELDGRPLRVSVAQPRPSRGEGRTRDRGDRY